MNVTTEISGGARVGNEETGAGVESSVGIVLIADAHAQADANCFSADVQYTELVQAQVTATGTVEKEGVGVGGSVTVFAKTGTEVEGHIQAGNHGVDVGASASIGNAAGISAEVSEKARYVGGTVGAGVSVGEHFEAGGSAKATYDNGVITVGVSGDIAAILGLDVDVSVSVDGRQITKDAQQVSKEVEKAVPVVVDTTKSVEKAVEKTAVAAGNAVANTTKSVTNTINQGAKKFFKKWRI